MRQGWCIGLRLPVQLRANNQHKRYISYLVDSNKELPWQDSYYMIQKSYYVMNQRVTLIKKIEISSLIFSISYLEKVR